MIDKKLLTFFSHDWGASQGPRDALICSWTKIFKLHDTHWFIFLCYRQSITVHTFPSPFPRRRALDVRPRRFLLLVVHHVIAALPKRRRRPRSSPPSSHRLWHIDDVVCRKVYRTFYKPSPYNRSRSYDRWRCSAIGSYIFIILTPGNDLTAITSDIDPCPWPHSCDLASGTHRR